VVLFARANQLGPGYFYQHLMDDAPAPAMFLALAALDDAQLANFQRAAVELQGGVVSAEFEALLPEEWPLFVRFAAEVYDLDAALLTAAKRGVDRRSAEGTIQPASELEILWRDILDVLQYQMPRAVFDTWLRSTRLIALSDHCFTISVKSSAAYQWLVNRLAAVIRRAIKQVVGYEAVLEFRVALSGQSWGLPTAGALRLAG
jgi:hypothetical protein